MQANINEQDKYQNLPVPQLNEALLNQIDCNIKGTHWSLSYQCITMIRAICKSYPQHTIDIFVKYGMVLLEIFNNGPTQNIKNILKLLMEVFVQGQNMDLQTIVAAFLPQILKKAANENGLIKQSCQQLLTVITTNCCYGRAIEVSTQLSCQKNVGLSQMAIKFLSVMIMNVGASLTQLNPSTLQMLTKGMSLHINGKRNNMKTSALDVCMFVFSQIGSENYIQLMNYSLNQQEIMTMTQAMQTHRTQKQKGPQLADLLKQHKSQQRQSGNWNQQGIR